MSATRNPRSRPAPDLESLPRFDLSCLFDSQEEPTEVTVFPASNEYDISTNWITVRVECAVPIDELR